ALAYNRQSRQLYAVGTANAAGATVTVVDTTQNKVIGGKDLGGQPRGAMADPTSDRTYILTRNPNHLRVMVSGAPAKRPEAQVTIPLPEGFLSSAMFVRGDGEVFIGAVDANGTAWILEYDPVECGATPVLTHQFPKEFADPEILGMLAKNPT